jgi:hypothetical protein
MKGIHFPFTFDAHSTHQLINDLTTYVKKL